jgi:hypothetical protein
MAVNLDNLYIPSNRIDSAIATWNMGIHHQEIRLVMNIEQNKLTANLEKFMEGTGKLTITLFSQKRFGNHRSSEFVMEKDLAIDHKNSVAFSAPASFNDMSWSPRAVLADGIGHVAVVALRPDDPYFMVKGVPANLTKMVVYRSYWNTAGGGRLIAGREWECSTGCSNSNGNIENKQFFSFLPAAIGNSAWNHIEIVLKYEVPNNWTYLLDLNHTLE